jgi:regulator of sirC expression with transglutaminase-like and TPR domain
MTSSSESSALQYWDTLVREDESLPLLEAALAIAQDEYPGLDIGETEATVDALARRLKARLPADAPMIHKLRMLNHYFFNDLHFRGNVNDYYDADNSYINKVIERRCGVPITLAVLYMEIGQQVGIPLQGLSFPGQFLVKLRVNDGAVVIDLFGGGKSLSKEDLEDRLEPYLKEHQLQGSDVLPVFLEAATPRMVLARILRNLKSIHSHDGDHRRLLWVLNRLVVLLPEDPSELRDRGLCMAALGNVQGAMSDLENYIDVAPDAHDRESVLERIDELRVAAKPPH